MKTYSWYAHLKKPSWAPPAWLFGPVWTVLYLIIALSFGKVFFMLYQNEISLWIALPFFLNIVFNLVFTPIQFGLRNNALAALDILLVLATLIWAISAIAPYSSLIAYAQIPYLLWVSFATILQLTVTKLNWKA